MERLVVPKFASDMGSLVAEIWEIKPREVTSKFVRGLVVSQGGFFGGVEGAKPEPGSVLGKSDLGDPFSPMPLSHPSIELCGFWRYAHLLHGDGLRTEEVRGLLTLLPLGEILGVERSCSSHGRHVVVVLLKLDLGLDLVNLRGC